MQQLPVDEEVINAVWLRARANSRPFEQLTFNVALRRVLGLPETATDSPVSDAASPPPAQVTGSNVDESQSDLGPLEDLYNQAMANRKPRARAPQADLNELARAGSIRNGEELFLVDYQGATLKQYKAKVSGSDLVFKGQRYSMSALARDLLKERGYQSDAVRGPAHWANANEVTIRELWRQVLEAKVKK